MSTGALPHNSCHSTQLALHTALYLTDYVTCHSTYCALHTALCLTERLWSGASRKSSAQAHLQPFDRPLHSMRHMSLWHAQSCSPSAGRCVSGGLCGTLRLRTEQASYRWRKRASRSPSRHSARLDTCAPSPTQLAAGLVSRVCVVSSHLVFAWLSSRCLAAHGGRTPNRIES